MYPGNQNPANGQDPDISQYRAVHNGHPIQGEARAGGLIIYVHATVAFSAIYQAVGTFNLLEKLAVVIPLPGQKFLVSN